VYVFLVDSQGVPFGIGRGIFDAEAYRPAFPRSIGQLGNNACDVGNVLLQKGGIALLPFFVVYFGIAIQNKGGRRTGTDGTRHGYYIKIGFRAGGRCRTQQGKQPDNRDDSIFHRKEFIGCLL